MLSFAHRKSRKQFRRFAQQFAHVSVPGKPVAAFRRVLPAQYPPMRFLDGRSWRMDVALQTSDPYSKYTGSLSGYHRIASVAQYELYIGEDALPDFTAAPAKTATAIPFDYAITPPGAGTKTVNAAVRHRNEYDLVSHNQAVEVFIIDTSGNLVIPDPTGPDSVTLRETTGYYVFVLAEYYSDLDAANAQADTWQVYATNTGVDPNPATDTPTETTMQTTPSIKRLQTRIGPYSAGDDVRVLVRCKRSSDNATDGNTTIYQDDMSPALSAPGNADAFGGSVYRNA